MSQEVISTVEAKDDESTEEKDEWNDIVSMTERGSEMNFSLKNKRLILRAFFIY